VTAFDSPARQTFVAEMVGEADLSNAVALNSTSFNAARMVGPAVAGLLIAGVGTGWVFVINALSFAAVLVALWRLRVTDLHRSEKALRNRGSLADGFRYVRQRPDLMAVLFMLLLIGTFGLNFAIYISTMAVMVYHAGAGTYGLLTSTMAVGSIAGALLAAQRDKPSIPLLMVGAGVFGLGCTLAALMPNELLFAATLVIIGISAQTFTTSTLSLAQMTTAPAVRGRVIAIVLAIAMGGTPIGAPIVGRVADSLGPRWALALAGASGFGAALVGARYLARHRGLRFGFAGGRWHWHMDDGELPGDSAPLR
jgi:MFS family permease